MLVGGLCRCLFLLTIIQLQGIQVLSNNMAQSTTPGFFRRSLGKLQDGVIRAFAGVDAGTSKASFYDCVDKTMDGETVSMSKFKGDVVLVVNVASK